MKIYINNPKENWIIDRMRAEWYKNNPKESTENTRHCDIIWIAAPWQWKLIPREHLISKRVVVTIHHIVPEKIDKNFIREFLYRDRFVHAYHVPNKYTAAFVKKLTKKPIFVIGYWYNSDIWNLSRPSKQDAMAKLQIPQNKFVIGSFQRDTEGADLKSPKLEKGPDIFCDYVEKICDVNTMVLLGGWRRQYVIGRLERSKIPYKYVEMAPIESLVDMYSACDLYIVSSRHEGGPQALFEASAMKIPIISTKVGLSEEILCNNCIVDLQNNCYIPNLKDIEENYNNVQKYDIINHKQEYLKMFKEVLSEA